MKKLINFLQIVPLIQFSAIQSSVNDPLMMIFHQFVDVGMNELKKKEKWERAKDNAPYKDKRPVCVTS